MPQFAYKAKNSDRNLIEGTVEAETEAAAIGLLGSQGVYPISLIEAGEPLKESLQFQGGRVTPRQLASTTRQLADLLGGGLPLLNALTLLTKQTENKKLRGIVGGLAASVRDGQSLSEAINIYPAVFPLLYINMVRAGEMGGNLEQNLGMLADLGESEAELKSKIINASAYPLFVLCAAIVMTIFLITYVIPQLSTVFTESGQLLPLPTRFLLGISGMITNWWWILLLAIACGGFGILKWYRSASGRAIADRLMLKLPGLGTLFRKLDTVRFARNLGVMIRQGVPVLQALDVVGSNVSNTKLREATSGIYKSVHDGASLSSALENSKQFPVFVSNMVAVGEESGRVDAAFLKVAATYDRETDRLIRTLTTILEPLLLVIVGGIVMFIVLAMLLPIFQIGLVVE